MSHPLQTPWTLYYQQPNPEESGKNDYASSIHKVGKFNTVEDFWSYYSHLKRPNETSACIEFHIFRDDICGMWEDEKNRNGGKWLLFLKKEYSSQIWEKTVLCLIGELMPEDVLGAVIAIKPETDILSFWTRDGRETTTDSALLSIAESISKALELPNGTVLKFKQHIDNNKFHSSNQRRALSYIVDNGQKNQRMKDKRALSKQPKQKP